MIGFRFRIRNPWPRAETIRPRDYVFWDRKIAKNKSVELQISKWSAIRDLFTLALDLNWSGEDHAGPEFEFGIGPYWLCFQIYDHRHWNWEQGRWELYPGEDDEDDEE